MANESTTSSVDWQLRNVKLSDNMLEALRCRAYDLHIPVSKLMRDVLQCWLSQTCNWEDPIFNRPPMIVEPIPMPQAPSNWTSNKDYHDALGFA